MKRSESDYLDFPKIREIEEKVANAWLASGAIQIEEYGYENTYYVNEFGHKYFCKNYPNFNRR